MTSRVPIRKLAYRLIEDLDVPFLKPHEPLFPRTLYIQVKAGVDTFVQDISISELADICAQVSTGKESIVRQLNPEFFIEISGLSTGLEVMQRLASVGIIAAMYEVFIYRRDRESRRTEELIISNVE